MPDQGNETKPTQKFENVVTQATAAEKAKNTVLDRLQNVINRLGGTITDLRGAITDRVDSASKGFRRIFTFTKPNGSNTTEDIPPPKPRYPTEEAKYIRTGSVGLLGIKEPNDAAEKRRYTGIDPQQDNSTDKNKSPNVSDNVYRNTTRTSQYDPNDLYPLEQPTRQNTESPSASQASSKTPDANKIQKVEQQTEKEKGNPGATFYDKGGAGYGGMVK